MQSIILHPQQNIFIVGPMGAGKSSIGKALAKSLQRPFYDTDQVIEQRSGVEVAWIFDVEGEPGFREREKKIIAELSQEKGIVLSTGGGAVVEKDNRICLAARGIVIYLTLSMEAQLERMLYDRKRPLVPKQDRQQALEALREQREPLYEEIADLTFNTDSHSISKIVEQIMQALKVS
jgi:shikimate kinase